MNLILPLMILAIAPRASIGERYPEATGIFHCTFDASSDQDFDRWPEGWTRRLGPGFPHYVKIEISQASAPGGRAIEIRLDGGAGVALSPPVPIAPYYDFVLDGYLQTEALQHDRAWFSITLLDGQHRPVETFRSEKVRDAPAWRHLRVGPVSPTRDDVRWAVVGLHLEPTGSVDLKGAARFADVWLGRLPRMSLATDPPLRIVDHPALVTIHCTASGLSPKGTTIGFELLDAEGNRIARTDRRFSLQSPEEETRLRPIRQGTGARASVPAVSPGIVGSARWAPPIPGPGFYRIVATMPAESGLVHHRGLTFAVVAPQHAPPGSEFGWSLPSGGRPLPAPVLNSIVAQAGVHWVKYPLWLDKGSEIPAREAIDFLDRLSPQGVEVIGMLSEPPEEVRSRLDVSKPATAADTFSLAPEAWAPSIEATMTRFGTRVRTWQLGRDRDASFVGFPGMVEKVERIKSELDRIGRDVNLALGWTATHPLPEVRENGRPWRAVSLSAAPSLSDRELPGYLAAAQQPGLRRWVVLEPLPERDYAVQDRAADLVRRMVAAKTGGAEGIFLADPLDRVRGLLDEDGSPREMFLPWRTAALALGGATPLGSVPLPGGSTNWVFARGQEATLIVWNEKPVREVVCLGDDVRQVDVWGRPLKPERTAAGHAIAVGPVPTLISGFPGGIARWQIDFILANDRLPSTFDRRHAIRLELKNGFDQGAEGSVELFPPEDWTIRPQRTRFRLAPGEHLQQPLEITLPVNVSSGAHRVRAEFAFFAGRPYRFSVARKIQVGMGDIRVEVSTQLTRAGELEVQQRLINRTDRVVSFRCQLFAPERRRLSSQIAGLGHGEDLRTYRFPDGRELIGKTLWLQAEEVDGPRVLNYRFVAEE